MKRLPPPDSSFLTSNYFRTFINFVEFTRKVDLPFPEKFIGLMVQKEYTPTMWRNDDVYTIYLEFLDRQVLPFEQATLSANTLMDKADKENIDVSEIFTKMAPAELIHLLRIRRISPWLLLCSGKFREFYTNRITPEQKTILDNMIRMDYWGTKMQEHADSIKSIKLLVKELRI